MASSLVQRANRVKETARQAPKTPEVLIISERDPVKSWERMTRRLLHVLAVLSLHKVLTEDLVTLNDEKPEKKKRDVTDLWTPQRCVSETHAIEEQEQGGAGTGPGYVPALDASHDGARRSHVLVDLRQLRQPVRGEGPFLICLCVPITPSSVRQ